MEWLQKSGIVGYILAGISILTLGVFLERFFIMHLERFRIRKGEGIIQRIAALIDESTGMKASSIEEIVTYRAEDEVEKLSSGLGFIRLASSVSPLLGLLGTVMGMIEAFRQVSMMGGAVKPAVLASGIWVALLTTAEGLIVAIIAFLMYHYLSFLLGRISKTLEKESELRMMEYRNGSAE